MFLVALGFLFPGALFLLFLLFLRLLRNEVKSLGKVLQPGQLAKSILDARILCGAVVGPRLRIPARGLRGVNSS